MRAPQQRRVSFEQLEPRELLAAFGWNYSPIDGDLDFTQGSTFGSQLEGDQRTRAIGNENGKLFDLALLDNDLSDLGSGPKVDTPTLNSNREANSPLALRPYISGKKIRDLRFDFPMPISYIDFSVLSANEGFTVDAGGQSTTCVFHSTPTSKDTVGICGNQSTNTAKRRVAVQPNGLTSQMTLLLTNGTVNNQGGPESFDLFNYFVPAFAIQGAESGLEVSEHGQTDSFKLSLEAMPQMYNDYTEKFDLNSLPLSGDVVVSLASSDPTEFQVIPSELRFTLSDWDNPRTVTVVGLNDNIPDTDMSGSILLSVKPESFHLYTGLTDSLSIVNRADTPPVAHAGGPYDVVETGQVLVSGRGSTDLEDTLSQLDFSWDFDRDGIYDDALGVEAIYRPADWPVNVDRTISLLVRDSSNNLSSATASLNIEIVPPVVADIIVAGSEWLDAFRGHISSANGNSLGYSLVGNHQQNNLTWVNLDTIAIQFNEDIGSFDATNLLVRGINTPDYANAVSSVQYNPGNYLATIVFSQPFTNDRITINLNATEITDRFGASLDGEWQDGISTISGNGQAGGDLVFGFNVLPGDVNLSGIVLADDVGLVHVQSFAEVGDPRYVPRYDVNGDGEILSNDVGIVNILSFTTLPNPIVGLLSSPSYSFGFLLGHSRSERLDKQGASLLAALQINLQVLWPSL